MANGNYDSDPFENGMAWWVLSKRDVAVCFTDQVADIAGRCGHQPMFTSIKALKALAPR